MTPSTTRSLFSTPFSETANASCRTTWCCASKFLFFDAV